MVVTIARYAVRVGIVEHVVSDSSLPCAVEDPLRPYRYSYDYPSAYADAAQTVLPTIPTAVCNLAKGM
jgi:hypothetical protein